MSETPETLQQRCAWLGKWSGAKDPLYRNYHDTEWGVPLHDPVCLFELLTLEGAQAGLSWITVLKKRQNYRKAFADFDIRRIAAFNESDILRLMNDPGLIRNRLKIDSTITNARAWLQLQERTGDVPAWLWSFVGGQPRVNAWHHIDEVPVTTPESDAMSRALKKEGFRFVGSTICQAFMQAAGMFNDHTIDCFRHGEILTHHST